MAPLSVVKKKRRNYLMEILAVIAPVVAVVALVFAYGLASWIGKVSEGTDRMKEIAG